MKRVDPIRNLEEIQRMKDILIKENRGRDLLLMALLFNTAMRRSDVLSLHVCDILDDAGQYKTIKLNESKTGKYNVHHLNQSITDALDHYFSVYPERRTQPNTYLFQSPYKNDTPIRPEHATRLIKKLAKDAGVQGNIGTHSGRESFGYHWHKQGKSLVKLMKKYNHSSPGQTLDYIRFTDEEMEKDVNEVCL